jgi:hypothetical protein
MTSIDWPTASLDPIARAKVLGRAIPSAAWQETIVDVPYERAWSWIRDLERSVPSFDRVVSRLRVRAVHVEDGAEQLALSVSNFGIPIPFEARIEEGFCLMQARARLYLVVMAATPADDGRRAHVLHLEAVPLPGTGFLRRFIQREVKNDLANMTRLLTS